MKTTLIRNIFALSARRAILVFELVFLGAVILSSCQIEKRQHMKGFFIGNSAESHNIRCIRNQTADSISTQEKTASFSEIVELSNADTISTSQLVDSVPERHISKEKSVDKCTKNFDFEYLKAFNNSCSRKASLQPVISLSNKIRKVHPMAILGIFLLGLSIISFLLFALLWVPGFVLLLCLLFFILSAVAFIFAKKKTLQNKDKWAGIVMIKTVLTIELVLLCVFLIAFVTVWFLVITI